MWNKPFITDNFITPMITLVFNLFLWFAAALLIHQRFQTNQNKIFNSTMVENMMLNCMNGMKSTNSAGANFTNHKRLQRYYHIIRPRSSVSSKWGSAWILTAWFIHCTLPSASVALHFYLSSFKHSFLLSAWHSFNCSFDSVCLRGWISITSVSLGDLWLRRLHFHIWRRRSARQT